LLYKEVMIKKSVFEDDLINGMQRELRSYEQKQGFENLDKAADYLNSAIQILEEAGMTAKADQILMVLSKIAARNKNYVRQMPALNILMEKGVTKKDLIGAGKGNALSKARVNTALRSLGYTDKEIGEFIGHYNLMHEQEAETLLDPERSFGKIEKWLEDPYLASDRPEVRPGEELRFESIAENMHDSLGKPVNDRHIRGLTPEKMTKNFEEHGSMFNLADDGAADDLLDADIDNLEVLDNEDEIFEDTD
jgi:hypothetical protein